MKVKLIQSHTESLIDLPFPENRGCGRLKLWAELPPLRQDLSDIKERSEGDLVFCLPFFAGGEKRWRDKKYIAEIGYMKRVFWLAYELLHFTDSQDTETGIYIICEDVLRPLLEPYRQLCNFPEELILTVSGLLPSHIAKVQCLYHLVKQKNFRYYMSTDLSLTFYDKISLIRELLEYWEGTPTDAIVWGKDPWHRAEAPLDFRNGNQVRYNFAAGPGNQIPPERFYIQMPKYFGEWDYESFLQRVMRPQIDCAGWLYGVSKTHLTSEGFQDFLHFVSTTHCIGSDESFMALYWYRYLAPNQAFFAFPKPLQRIRGLEAMQNVESGTFGRVHSGLIDTGLHDFYLRYYANKTR